MQIICKDGTTIPCEEFEAVESGVLFFESAQATEDESEETEDIEARASGFVPVTELQFVLPDAMVQQQPPATGQHRGVGQPPQQLEGMAQQQGMQQPPGPQGGR